MAMPTDLPIIDLMLGISSDDTKRSHDFMRPRYRDAERLKSFDFPVEYTFKDVPSSHRVSIGRVPDWRGPGALLDSTSVAFFAAACEALRH